MKYNEDAKLIWESFLNKTDIEFSQYKPYIEKDTDCYAVIIEPREHTDMLLSIRNTMYYLNENNSKMEKSFSNSKVIILPTTINSSNLDETSSSSFEPIHNHGIKGFLFSNFIACS